MSALYLIWQPYWVEILKNSIIWEMKTLMGMEGPAANHSVLDGIRALWSCPSP